MPELYQKRPRRSGTAHAVCKRALVGSIAGALWITTIHAVGGDDQESPPPHHPYLAPASSLAEMASGDPVERAMARSAPALFPEVAEGTLPATQFGVLVLPSFGRAYTVLFRVDLDGGTHVEKREPEFTVESLTSDELLDITTKSRPLHPEIAAASITAIRRALANSRPHLPGGWMVLDGVSYYFFSRDRVGRAHEPDPSTEAGRLVELVRALRRFVDGEADQHEARIAAENALRTSHGSTEESQ